MTYSIRDDIIWTLQKRVMLVSDMKLAVRNPKTPPSSDYFPACSILFGPDKVEGFTRTGDYPTLKRVWSISTVIYIIGSDGDDETAEVELGPMCNLVRAEIYRGNATFDGLCTLITEQGMGSLLKAHIGEPGIGQRIEWLFAYEDDVSLLFET